MTKEDQIIIIELLTYARSVDQLNKTYRGLHSFFEDWKEAEALFTPELISAENDQRRTRESRSAG